MTTCKAKFGISFHANMSLEDIVGIWCRRATQEIKDKYPEVNDAMEIAKTALLAVKAARAIVRIAKDGLELQLIAQNIASATLTQTLPALAAQYALKYGSEYALDLANAVVGQASVSLTAELGCQVTVSEEINQAYLTPLDIQLKTLQDLLSINICNSIITP